MNTGTIDRIALITKPGALQVRFRLALMAEALVRQMPGALAGLDARRGLVFANPAAHLILDRRPRRRRVRLPRP